MKSHFNAKTVSAFKKLLSLLIIAAFVLAPVTTAGAAEVVESGAQAQKDQISIGTRNDPLLDAEQDYDEPPEPTIPTEPTNPTEPTIAPTVVDSGACGDGLTWVLTDDGLLRIYGTGDMYGYTFDGVDYIDDAPWYSYRNSIVSVVMEPGVTSVGGYAFYCCRLTSVSIPNSVTFIGESAFDNCFSLTSVNIPEGVAFIGDSAFADCESLYEISVGSGNTAYCSENGVLFDKDKTVLICYPACKPDTIYEIPDSVTEIGLNAFSYCNNLFDVVIPDGVTTIRENSFHFCDSLTSVTIPASVTSIEIMAFNQCRNLAAINVDSGNSAYTSPGGVLFDKDETTLIFFPTALIASYSVPYGVTDIGSYAFYCSHLQSISFPETVTYLGELSFCGCSSLLSIDIPAGVSTIAYQTFIFCQCLTNVTIPASVTDIEQSAFFGCTSLTDVYYGGAQADRELISIGAENDPLLNAQWHYTDPIGSGVVASGACGDDLTWTLTDEGVLTISGTNGMYDFSSGVTPWNSYSSSITSVVIEDGVTSIGKFAFTDCAALQSVSIADTVTIIGEGAFLHCRSLAYANIGSSVETIGREAFESCSALSAITIPNSVEYIGDYAFNACINAEELTLGSGVEYIGDEAFSACDSLTTVTIPESVDYIGYSAFKGCRKLESINVSPNNLYYCSDDGVLYDKDQIGLLTCPAKRSGDFTVPDGVEYIDDFAFANCSYLRSVSIPDSVDYIGVGAFMLCSNIQEFIIPDNSDYFCLVDGIVYDKDVTALYCCPGKKSGAVSVPKSVTYIVDYAFDGCGNLEELTLPYGISYIGESAFMNCPSLVAVTIPETVKTIGFSAFFNSGLTKVTIPGSVSVVGDYAFSRCNSLTSVTISDGVSDIGRSAFFFCSALKTVSIPTSVTAIRSAAFSNCPALSDVYYGGQIDDAALISIESGNDALLAADWHYLTVIDSGMCGDDVSWEFRSDGMLMISGSGRMMWTGNDAPWEQYKNDITSVVIEDWVENIWGEAFSYCSNLASVSICDSVNQIGRQAFEGCSSLTNIKLPYSLSYISTQAFSWCSSLTGIWIPDQVERIDMYAFSYCTALERVTFKTDRLTKIDRNVFSGCSSLTNVIIPDNVETICSYAFYNCSALTNVTLPSNVKTIEEYAFARCFALSSIDIPDCVYFLGPSCFEQCTGLQSVKLPSALTTVSEGLFANCVNLTGVTIPNGMTKIGPRAFYRCVSLADIVLPDGMTAIEENSFSSCESLESITIPETMTSIGSDAFNYSGLTDVYYNGTEEQWQTVGIGSSNDPLLNAEIHFRSISASGTCGTSVTWELDADGVLTVRGSGAIADFSGQSSPWAAHAADITTVIIRDGVTDIGAASFSDCVNLTSVTIPESVTSIGEGAFSGCAALKDVYYRGTQAQWNDVVVDVDNDPLFNAKLHTRVIIASGTCGTSVTWELEPDGLLIVSGEGAMDDYADSSAPWFNNKDKIRSLSIGQGITYIGTRAFAGLTAMRSATIPGSVTDTGAYAFDGSGLYTVEMLDGVKSIGSYSFTNCRSLAHVIVPDSMESYGEGAFYGCTYFQYIYLPEALTSIGDNAFSGCERLAKVYYGGSEAQRDLLSVGSGNALLLNSQWLYDIPACIAEIGPLMYDVTWDLDVNGLMTIRGSGEMTSVTWMSSDIQSKTYSVVIEDGVTSIRNNAFMFFQNMTSLTIPDSVTSIGYDAFEGCSSLTSVTIPGSVQTIGTGVFFGCYALSELTICEGVETIGGGAFYTCRSLTSVSIPDSVKSIGNGAFTGCEGLTSLDLGEGVETIGDYAFWGCCSLTSVTIPDSVTTIGRNPFCACSALAEINVSENNGHFTVSDGTLFDKAKTRLICCLSSNTGAYAVPDGVSLIDEFSFYECVGLTNVMIPSGVTSIGMSVFNGCSALSSVILPLSVESIDQSAFFNCSALTDVYYGGSEEQRDQIVFGDKNAPLLDATWHYNCSVAAGGICGDNLLWMLSDSGVLTITGTGAMYDYSADNTPWNAYKDGISSVVIESGVSTIGSYAFYNCASIGNASPAKRSVRLASVSIADTVTVIGDHAFAGCSALAEITIPEGVTTIGDQAFAECSALTEVTIPEGVTTIGEETFADCTALTSVTIPNTVTEIGENAFQGCEELTDVYYDGTSEEWQEINIGDENSTLTDADIHFSDSVYAVALTDYTKGLATITGLTDGEEYAGEVTFTVACDKACAVFFSTDGGTTCTRVASSPADDEAYSFTVNVEHEMTVYVAFIGDVNLDGKINTSDITQLKRFICGRRPFDDVQTVVANVNGDTRINTSDITQLKRFICGRRTFDW